MNTLENMLRLSRIDDILEHCIEECSKDDLADCVRFLAINLARYRQRYGALPAIDIQRLLINDSIDDETAMTLAEGMLQCAIALAQIKGRRDVLEKLKSMDETFEVDWKGVTFAGARGEKAAADTPRFRSERFFHHASLEGAQSGWYFTVRGGLVYGPFPDEETAKKILAGLVASYRRRGISGGR